MWCVLFRINIPSSLVGAPAHLYQLKVADESREMIPPIGRASLVIPGELDEQLVKKKRAAKKYDERKKEAKQEPLNKEQENDRQKPPAKKSDERKEEAKQGPGGKEEPEQTNQPRNEEQENDGRKPPPIKRRRTTVQKNQNHPVSERSCFACQASQCLGRFLFTQPADLLLRT